MPVFKLPLARGETPHIEGSAEQLAGLLAPPNDPMIVARVGEETLKDQWRDMHGNGMRYVGKRFSTRDGWVQGERYLLFHDGHAVAVVNITHLKDGARKETRMSNVYVGPEVRRQGLASALLSRAFQDHPRLISDSHFSEAGAALLGHAPMAPRRTRAPR